MAYVVIVRVDREPTCWYAIPFAGGHHLLREDCIDANAARDTARYATVPADPTQNARIRQLRTKRIGNRVLTDQRKSSRDGTLGELFFNPYVEILDEIDAKPQNTERFGSALTGGRGLAIRKKLLLTDLPNEIVTFEEAYIESQTRAENAVADAMYTVKDEELLARLDADLVAKVRDPNEQDLTFSIPDFVCPDEPPEIRFTKLGRNSPVFSDDVSFSTYRDELVARSQLGQVDLDYLKGADVLVGAGEKPRHFSVYRCLSALVEIDGISYVHDDSSWYSVPTNLRDEVNRQIDEIQPWTGDLPSAEHRITEPAYNMLAGAGDFLTLDARVIPPFEGETTIEICDLLTIWDDILTLVHVKRDFSSSTLSHCFEQGRVSALMLQEQEPRSRFLSHITSVMRRRRPAPPWSRRLPGFLGNDFRPQRTRVVFAILGNWNERSPSNRLPFFSRITLLDATQVLRGRGFDVRLAQIQMPGPPRLNA
jgi:uncharacterized protein (TIGR04141 family)